MLNRLIEDAAALASMLLFLGMIAMWGAIATGL